MTIQFRSGGSVERRDWRFLPAVSRNRELLRTRAPTNSPRRILMLCSNYKMPYRVLRCATADGALGFALGNRVSKALKYSRSCAEFIQTDIPIDGAERNELAREINKQVSRLKIDVVLAADGPSTRSLIAIRDRVAAPCFPMPVLEVFDLLNDKWRFHCLCKSLGVRVPESRLFEKAEDLKAAFDAGEFSVRQIAKPLGMSGGVGCVTVDPANLTERLSRINYAPILLQEFVEGEDVSASVLCEKGVIKAFVAHTYRRDVYRKFPDEPIQNDIGRIASHLAHDGVFNFDMRRAADGSVRFVECNPRFFFRVAMSMLAGVNFVALGLGQPARANSDQASVTVRFPKALLAVAWAPWSIEAESWKALRFVLSDPAPYLREELGFENGPGRP